MNFLKEVLPGLLIVCGVAVSWTCSTQFTKSALSIDSKHFYAPYSMVWFNTCFMIVCFPAFLLYNRFFGGLTMEDACREAGKVFGQKVTFVAIIQRTLPFLLLWIAANYAYSNSLGYVTASAASSIISSNTLMVGVLSWLLLREALSVLKIFAIIFAVAGVCLIYSDREFAGSLLGVGLVLFSALAAAVYKVLFKLIIGNASLGQVSLFMSCLGVLNLSLNIIPTVLMVWSGLDHIEWHFIPWLPLAGSALLAMIFNFFVNFGIALLTPLVISIGMLCGLPLNAVVDITFRGMKATPTFIAGSCLLLVSFVLTTLPLDQFIQRLSCRHKKNEVESVNEMSRINHS